jgi:hypothetical protein
MKTVLHKRMLMICAMTMSLSAFAAKLPDYYPAVFDRWGTIDYVDLGNHSLVVNDRTVHVASDLQVHTMNARFASGSTLHKGTKIGFGTTGGGSPAGAVVTEVWVLPADYTPSQNTGDSTQAKENRP